MWEFDNDCIGKFPFTFMFAVRKQEVECRSCGYVRFDGKLMLIEINGRI